MNNNAIKLEPNLCFDKKSNATSNCDLVTVKNPVKICIKNEQTERMKF